MRVPLFLIAILPLCTPLARSAADEKSDELAAKIRKLEIYAFGPEKELQKKATEAIGSDLRRRRDQANDRNRAEWKAIKTRAQWEKYRDERLARLRMSLGQFPAPPKKLNVKVTSTVKGDGFVVENLVYESRPGQWVTANLYVPAKPRDSMPGIIIQSAHHRDKWQGELQDMGMTWARKGCLVLAIDEVGYGERRAHPFNNAKDYDKEYRVSRQDYYFRYDSGIQLQLAGDSLMGWFVWDLMRGVDLLLQRPGIDPKRIIILGAVAGGGDPCAVAAALDPRIKGAVPFNFGGAQPETRFPLPKDAEKTFNYLGGTYWDSTRGLRRGGADGFFHWLIVGSIAPRPLIYAHEFAWDKENDPVWKRFETIWGDFYDARDRLGSANGKGSVKGRPPTSTHCTNIGKYHRQFIHPLFKQWFDIDVQPEDEYSKRFETKDLTCWTPEARRELKPVGFVERVSKLGAERAQAARAKLEKLKLADRRKQLQKDWRELLGPIEPTQKPTTKSGWAVADGGFFATHFVVQVDSDVMVPLTIFSASKGKKRKPAVIVVCQSGREAFIKKHADAIAELVEAEFVVCIPDVRGTGEIKSGNSRGRTSGDGNRSVNMLLYDETLLGQRLRDVRSIIRFVKGRYNVDPKRIALWGDSLAPVNSDETNFKVPRGVSGRPHQSEPLGGLLAMLTALFDDDVKAVYVHGGLSAYESVLSTYQVLIPHDVVVPNVLEKGDLCDLAAMLAPRPLRLEGMVDGTNRRMTVSQVKDVYQPALRSYRQAGGAKAITISDKRGEVAEWFKAQLKN